MNHEIRKKLTKQQLLKENSNLKDDFGSPYDLSRVGMGFNQPCPRCGLPKNRKASSYEPIGFINYCNCK
jgi:hypothetical protein